MGSNPMSYTIDRQIVDRFDQRNTVFSRIFWDKEASFYGKDMYQNIPKILTQKRLGYSRLELAQVLGSWTVYDYFHQAFSWKPATDPNNVMNKPEFQKEYQADPQFMTKKVKTTAKLYGASLVGITELDRLWIYSHDMKGDPLSIPEKYRYAIVMAIAMNPEAIKTSPAFPACTASAIGYSKMAFCIACLAEFIRRLGYDAIPMGNDTALSIPLAIDAGLGELGRNGLLITPEYGPCIRICKVFTNLPLIPDSTREFGITDICKRCSKCAQACQVEAIQTTADPSFKVACPSNNQGILRWAVNHDNCYSFWTENGGDCSTCIAVCPYTPGNKLNSSI